MTSPIRADFTAAVAVGDRDDEPTQTRVVLSDERLVFASDDAKQSVTLTNVFDIVQDISPRATPTSTETVTIAYRVGESRHVASVRGPAKTLFRFQQLLFKALLDDTDVIVRHTVGGERKLAASKLPLSVTATTVRLGDASAETTVAIPREEITEFKTGTGSLGDDQQPVVTLYWVAGDRPSKTAICLPTLRLFNLFGRYVRSTRKLQTEATVTRPDSVDVLLVDDDPDDLEVGEIFLRRQSDHFSITTATSGAGGLDRLEERRVDCVVSDFGMPGMDGIEFLNAVRERYPDLPFILFTGQGNEELAKRAIIDDVTDYVEKGVGTRQYTVLAERIWKAVQ